MHLAGHRESFVGRWSLGRAAAGADAPHEWWDIPAPATVAAALRAIGRWSMDAPAQDFDADDWWFRAVFDAPAQGGALAFGGLAGMCEISLNGEPLLASTNMHLAHLVEPALRPHGNLLEMRFSSLAQWLTSRRPRPRWRAPMVAHQQLRHARISLLGRTPGWSPPAAAVGPWRAIEWVARHPVSDVRMQAHVEGDTGVIDLQVMAEAADRVVLRARRHGRLVTSAPATRVGHQHTLRLDVPQVDLWWPHTHGEPALYDLELQVDATVIPIGRTGFRHLEVETTGGDFAVRINGVPVFCRGACWTPLDVVGLQSTPEQYAVALTQVRDAGMNMLRVCGSMVYEDDAFHDQCDALGLLVWQDFMFANMDYPESDPAFAASVRAEVAQQLGRWQARPSMAILCGNSEAEQQAAMWGSPRETWSQALFTHDIAEMARAVCPQAHYWPSSAHGGAFPHQNDQGTSSYYGVGAYRRDPEDARRSGVRFATEALAFANLPDEETTARIPAAWKTRTPRDLGAGWDFEDVRDHYLQRLHGVDPAALRSIEQERYLAMSRAVSAEVMAQAFGEWRRAGSACRGALVWFLRDLWAGAGWGLLDDLGRPKAAFHGCRRAFAPIAIFLSDEGTNGLCVHLVNDPASPLDARVQIAIYRDDGLRMEQAERTLSFPGHGALSMPAMDWFDGFVDLTRAYRFGPAEHALVVVTLVDAKTGAQLGQAFHYPEGRPSRLERGIGLRAEVGGPRLDGTVEVLVQSDRHAQSVHLAVPGYLPEDDHFHLAPGGSRRVRLRPTNETSRFKGHLGALNTRDIVTLELPS